MKQLKHTITLYQAGVEATFKLTDEEFRKMQGLRYNFEWFAWADYELSRSKAGRFNRIFDYHKGDIISI